MLVIGGAVLGAALGAITARRKGGNRLDMLQYAAACAIALAIVGLFATVFSHRAALSGRTGIPAQEPLTCGQ